VLLDELVVLAVLAAAGLLSAVAVAGLLSAVLDDSFLSLLSPLAPSRPVAADDLLRLSVM